MPNVKEKKPFLPEFITKKRGKDAEPNPGEAAVNEPFVMTLPGINLIPQAVLEGYELKALQKRFVQLVAAALALILIIGAVLFGIQKITEIRVAAAEKEAASYATQIKALQPYENYRDSVQAKRKSIGEKMSTEVDTGKVIGELLNAAKASGVKLSESITVNVNTGEQSAQTGTGSSSSSGEACATADPFNSQPSVGCVSFTGQGNRGQISAFLNALDKNPHFNNAFVPTTSEGETPGFTGSVNFTGAFLTNNYSHLVSGDSAQSTPDTTTAPTTAPTEGATTP